MSRAKNSERVRASTERRERAARFSIAALQTNDVFDEQDRPTYWALDGLSIWQDRDRLLLGCVFSEDDYHEGTRLRRNASYDDVLGMIREGHQVAGSLEVILAPAEATGSWPLQNAERVILTPGEWRVSGWKHWSRHKVGRANEKLAAVGWSGQFEMPYMQLWFCLAINLASPERKRVIAARVILDASPA